MNTNIIKTSLSSFLLMNVSSSAFSQEDANATDIIYFDTIIEGTYQNKNLYFHNPSVNDSTYCVTAIWVNGTPILDKPETSAFEIKLDTMNFKPNDPLVITIRHYSGCKPKLLNPQVY